MIQQLFTIYYYVRDLLPEGLSYLGCLQNLYKRQFMTKHESGLLCSIVLYVTLNPFQISQLLSFLVNTALLTVSHSFSLHGYDSLQSVCFLMVKVLLDKKYVLKEDVAHSD